MSVPASPGAIWHANCKVRVIMTRAPQSAAIAIDSDWKLVSQGRPCPVCGAEDKCGVHTEDEFVCCARAPSEWKLTNGSWLHRRQSPAANTNGVRF